MESSACAATRRHSSTPLLCALTLLLGLPTQGAGEVRLETVAGNWATGEAALLAAPGASCQAVQGAVLRVVERGEDGAALSAQEILAKVPGIVEQLEVGDGSPIYSVLFGDVAGALRLALDAAQLLSLAAMVHKGCFSSSARLAMGRALLPLQKALQQQISTMWWMFDIGSYSNTNSPKKHLEAVFKTVQHAKAVFEHLAAELPPALASEEHFWGHGAHGMFMNSTVIYRSLFPEAAILDRGLLRGLLPLLPRGSELADFGALDGQYARWLNDTGWVTAFAFDGVEGVAELTGGAVLQADLAEELVIPWRHRPFDWALCLEVAEHIPPDREEAFLRNLERHASTGLILSWAHPGIEGEGHVNCLPLDESRARVEALGFVLDEPATEALRAASHVPWIAASVAVYRRVAGS
uniref:Methyltransferase type 11 domain-containing protein n=1 Tax=Alexandrium monilatum TaxID=311494 RepID=A0A7S4W387_9DINO